jgi:type VI secretion system protein ImpF
MAGAGVQRWEIAMAGKGQSGIKLSILDRIIGLDPEKRRSATVVRSSQATIRDLEESVHRDLTALLNTRRATEPVPAKFKEACASLLMFGLPDFTGCSALDRAEQERFRREIENAIRLFEPRLSSVTVSLVRSAREAGRTDSQLRYHVRALLNIEPEPEPLYFDAVLESDTGRVNLETSQPKR